MTIKKNRIWLSLDKPEAYFDVAHYEHIIVEKSTEYYETYERWCTLMTPF